MSNKSFERSVYDGDINGPDWPVVDENGRLAWEGTQDYGHTQRGRAVSTSGSACIGYVIDYQERIVPMVTPPLTLAHGEIPEPGIAYTPRITEPRI